MNNTRIIRNRVRTTNGRWTKTQNDRFMKGLERFGRDWVCVQKVVKTRTLTQVRSHAQKVFLKLSYNEIEELIPQESSSSEPKIIPKLENVEQEQCKEQTLQVFSQNQSKKIEGNLVQLFMHAIQQQSRELQCHQDNTTVVQQNETKLQNKGQSLEKINDLAKDSQKQNENPQKKGLQKKKELAISDQPQININNIYPIYLNLKETSINKN